VYRQVERRRGGRGVGREGELGVRTVLHDVFVMESGMLNVVGVSA